MYGIATRYSAGHITATTRYGADRPRVRISYPFDAGEGTPAHRRAVDALMERFPEIARMEAQGYALKPGTDPQDPDRILWVWVIA